MENRKRKEDAIKNLDMRPVDVRGGWREGREKKSFREQCNEGRMGEELERERLTKRSRSRSTITPIDKNNKRW